MWTWIYYTVITFGALALCSTFAIIQIMSSENSGENTPQEETVLPTKTIDIESGEMLTYRRNKQKPKQTNDIGVLNF